MTKIKISKQTNTEQLMEMAREHSITPQKDINQRRDELRSLSRWFLKIKKTNAIVLHCK